jgi:4-hydroxy-tetrahydrodipicolinate synthase
MGKIKEEFRLPLCEMSKANRDKLKGVLKGMKLVR